MVDRIKVGEKSGDAALAIFMDEGTFDTI